MKIDLAPRTADCLLQQPIQLRYKAQTGEAMTVEVTPEKSASSGLLQLDDHHTLTLLLSWLARSEDPALGPACEPGEELRRPLQLEVMSEDSVLAELQVADAPASCAPISATAAIANSNP
jgi:hypothetical protein